MIELFLEIVNRSISASWLILAVVLLRLILKKAPKRIHMMFWGLVAVRLICPFTIESALSVIPGENTFHVESEAATAWPVYPGNTVIEEVTNVTNEPVKLPDAVKAEPAPQQIVVTVCVYLWLLGASFLTLYTIISYWKLRQRVAEAIPMEKGIYQCGGVESPFVMGILRPRIYLPFHLKEQDVDSIVAHEKAHIEHGDHWWKPFGFCLLIVYWFNPFIWLAYVLFCRDIELACDERVIRRLQVEQRAAYSQALLNCSMKRKEVVPCPLAFGEVGVKERVRNVMQYKKPAFWITLTAWVACILVAVCFLTNPKEEATRQQTQEKLAEVKPTNTPETTAKPSAAEIPERKKLHIFDLDSMIVTPTVPKYEFTEACEQGTVQKIHGMLPGTGEGTWYIIEIDGIEHFYMQYDFEEKVIYTGYAIVSDRYSLANGLSVGMTGTEVFKQYPNMSAKDFEGNPIFDDGEIEGWEYWNGSIYPRSYTWMDSEWEYQGEDYRWHNQFDYVMVADIDYKMEDGKPIHIALMIKEDIVAAITFFCPTAN